MNVGRANETTPEQQAELRLISRVNKLKDKGYKEFPVYGEELQYDQILKSLKGLKGTDANGLKLPMLAQKDIQKITFPGYLQRKYDGMRGILYWDGDSLKIRSRNGKVLSNLEHILEYAKDLPKDWQLDGELYAHGYNLQSIVSLTKRKQKDTLKIKYRVYDIILEGTPYEERYFLLRDWYMENQAREAILLVATVGVSDWETVWDLFNKYRAKGYEGAMWRDPNMDYEAGERSWGLIKIKDFLEEDFEIIGVKEATGRDQGTAIFTCITLDGAEFDVRPMGTRETRRDYLDNFEEYEGKLLTVRFQSWTGDGKPFHARGIIIRDYE
jgi:DNA ligase 1